MSGATMTLCLSHAPGLARDTEAQYGQEFRKGLDEAIDLVREFDPTLVVVFGSDHRNAYADIVPAMSVVLSAEGDGADAALDSLAALLSTDLDMD